MPHWSASFRLLPSPIGTLRNVLEVGTMLYISGQGPPDHEDVLYKGKVGRDVNTKTANEHARLVGTCSPC